MVKNTIAQSEHFNFKLTWSGIIYKFKWNRIIHHNTRSCTFYYFGFYNLFAEGNTTIWPAICLRPERAGR